MSNVKLPKSAITATKKYLKSASSARIIFLSNVTGMEWKIPSNAPAASLIDYTDGFGEVNLELATKILSAVNEANKEDGFADRYKRYNYGEKLAPKYISKFFELLD
jgi:hypothetical protein